ncbi:MAG: glucosaminidase domain-containing protein [Flavobacteriaceae bacterium]|nr:glucosaminidase domain-containing protein [Flavobacteriaceae bacterium]
MKRYLIVLILSVFVLSCGSKKKIVTKKNAQKASLSKQHATKVNREKTIEDLDAAEDIDPVEVPKIEPPKSAAAYVDRYKDVAISEMEKYGIPASITLAQGILESGSGKGRLAVEANNHFGIKCHGWKGAKIYHDDDKAQECFRKYTSAAYSFRDHSEFLVRRKRYMKLFKLEKNDYKGWAKELRRAGYATDKKYPEKLIFLIERYNLTQYDTKVLGEVVVKNEKHIVEKGDTLYSISKKYNIGVNELKKINGLQNSLLHIGQVLYVKPLPKH